MRFNQITKKISFLTRTSSTAKFKNQFTSVRKPLTMKTLLCFLLLCIGSISYAQNTIPDFGAFTEDEKSYKECPFDKDADAVVFFDKATSNYDDEYQLVTSRDIRFKILKDKGKERGNIHIFYESGDDFEFLRDVDAVILSYDDQNNPVITKLDHKAIYKNKINSIVSEVTFALPNVKVGSIIEYKYESVKKSYDGLKDWKFQMNIPVLLSTYDLYILPNCQFAYTVYKSSYLQIDIKPDQSQGKISFTMKNIPGLRDEPFMAADRDYLQRVTFQLSGYTNYMGEKKLNTWEDITRNLLNSEYFGTQLNKNISNTGELKALCDGISSEIEKMKVIHNYIRTHIVWNQSYGIETYGIKSAWEKKKGSTADINLLLINLLKDNGLDAYPILISERDNGKVDTTYPYTNQFDLVAAYILVDGKSYILDGTDTKTPTGIIPFTFLNTKGFIVDRKKGGFITITDNSRKDRGLINILAQIDPTGIIKGQAAVYNYDYARLDKERMYNNDISKYKDDYAKTYSVKIDSLKLEGTESDSLPLTEIIDLSSGLNKSGNYYLLNYNLFTGYNKNPFVSNNRFTNIDFGCLTSDLLNASFIIPDNFAIESLPKNITIKAPDNSMSLTRMFDKQDNTIRCMAKIDIQKSEFTPEEYQMVQGFFKQMLDYLNEPIVLKAK
jgi:hypothetical protein